MSGILGDYNWDNVFGSTGLTNLVFVKCVAPISGEINTIRINSATTSANKMKCGIYADNAGAPGVFLEKTEEQTPNAGEMTFTLLSGVTVVAGTVYWLTVQRDVALTVYYYTDNTEQRIKNTWTYDTWTDNPSPIGNGDSRLNMYALIESTNKFSTGWDTNWANAVTHANPYKLLGVRFKASSSFDATNLNCSLRKHATSGATECKIALYNDNAGVVGTLVNVTDAIPVVDDTANDQTVTGEITPSSLVKDTYYWLILEANGNVRMRYTSVYYSWKRLHIASWTYDTFNDGPIGSPTNNGRVLLYATAEAPPVTINIEESLGFAETVDLDVSNETINVEEGLGFSETVELDVSNETINVDESLGFTELVGLETSTVGVIDIFESLGFGDQEYLQTNTIDITENLGVAETINLNNAGAEVINVFETLGLSENNLLRITETVNGSSRIISFNPLMIVTDTDPAVLIEIDVSNPETPTWYNYTLNVPPETVTNARDITYNASNGYLYITCADGQLLKVDATDFYTREQIDTGDLNDLINVDTLPTYFKTYASTDDATGEIILLDEAEIKSVSLDIRYAQTIQDIVPIQVNTVLANNIPVDARVLAVTTQVIGLDIRFLKYDYSEVSNNPIDYTDWIVQINGVGMVPVNDINMKSIIVTHNTDNKSTASFILHRQHDKLNFTNENVSSEITNNNAVKIYIDGNLVFDGKVSSISSESEAENVTVTAQAVMPSSKKQTVNIPLASVGEQLNLYHCLIDDVQIDNPYVDSDLYQSDEVYGNGTVDLQLQAPEFFKGVKADLGVQQTQKISRWTSFSSNTVKKIQDGTFVAKPNWTYFWLASIKYLSFGAISGKTSSTTNRRYIGTSLNPISSDVIELISSNYSYQRQYADDVKNLGYYYIGSAPYSELGSTNGILRTASRWEDRADGLYNVKDASYNYVAYTIQVANLEYEKLQNINGDILPITSSDIDLSINAYFYYNVGLLTRLNITNTITSNIYNRLNGFPVAVKSISLSSNTMRATLSCDNQKSQEELDAIDKRYPDASSSERPDSVSKRYTKYNIASHTSSTNEFTIADFDLFSLDI